MKGLSPQLQIGSNASTAISCHVSQQLSLTITAPLSSRLMCCGWHQHLPAVCLPHATLQQDTSSPSGSPFLVIKLVNCFALQEPLLAAEDSAMLAPG